MHNSTDQHSLQLQIPLEWNAKKVYPVEPNIVKQPNDLLDQILENDSLPARKVFYIVLAKNHIAQKDQLEYVVPFTDIYRSKKNAKQRGITLLNDIRKAFQHTSFAVDTEFVRLVLKTDINVPYVSPFSLVGFNKGCFHITLTSHFKQYLQYIKEYDLKKGWTRGDLKLLLSFQHRATDKLYWIIRNNQWIKGTMTIHIEELKFKLGYTDTSNKNFCNQTLNAIEKELKGTWAEFEYRKITKGREIREIKLYFDKDDVVKAKLKNDLKYKFELELLTRGVFPVAIHNIRHLILNQDTFEHEGKVYTWSTHYVMWTIRFVDHEHSAGKVKDKAAFLHKALFSGYFAKPAAEMPLDYPESQYALPLGPCIGTGVTINATKAFTEVYLTEWAATQGMSLEEYIAWVKENKGITLCRYINPTNGMVYFLDSAYIKRLKVLETKSAIERKILVQN